MIKSLFPTDPRWWKDRVSHLWGYLLVLIVILVIMSGALGIFRHFFPIKKNGSSATAIKTIESGGTANITNINYKPEENTHGLYVSLGSDKATVGVYKTFANRFEIQLGGGETYDGEAVAEVTAKVRF